MSAIQVKTTQFLYEASQALPLNDLFTTIRSRMMTNCLNITNKTAHLNVIPRCDACGVMFKDVPPINFVNPVPKPKGYRKITNSTCNTKYKILSLKKFNKYKNDKQIMVAQCQICGKQEKTLINKFGHTKDISNYGSQPSTKKKKSKKKKKKDFAGLDKAAVKAFKRSLENEEANNNNHSPKRLKTSVIDLVSPTKNILTPNKEHLNTSVINLVSPKTSVIELDSPTKKQFPKTSDFISFDSPPKKLPVIEISDSETSNSSKKQKKKKRSKQKNTPVQQVPQTPKIKNNNNVVLVSEHNTAEKNKKKLNNLSNFLKNSAITKQTENKGNLLQNFLSSLT